MLPSQKQIDFVEDMARYLNIELPNMTDRRAVVAFINQHKYEFYKKRDNDIRDRIIEEIDIQDFAQELGYHVRRIGRYFTLEEYDSVRIDPQKKRFWRNSHPGAGSAIGAGGDVIDFAVMFANMDMHEALTYFTNRVQRSIKQGPAREKQTWKKQETENVKLQLPKRVDNMRRVFAYLTKIRMLDKEVVQFFVDEQMLYQDVYGNCVFVGYDDSKAPVYGFLRGTNTERKYIGDCMGSNYEYGLYLNFDAENLIIAESVIDGMSIMSLLKKQGRDFKAYDYLFLCGSCKYEALINHLLRKPKKKVYIAVDNDYAGHLSVEKIREALQCRKIEAEIIERLPVKEETDWNEAYQEAQMYGTIQNLRF